MFQRTGLPAAGSLLSARLRIAFICVFSLASGLIAQGGTSRLAGVVTDSSGAVVENAQITVRETASGITKVTTTDQTGAWAIAALPPGRYAVRAAAPGFAVAQQGVMILGAGAQVTVDLKLQPAGPTNSVTVTGLTGPDRDTMAPELVKTNDTASLVSDFSGIDLFNEGGCPAFLRFMGWPMSASPFVSMAWRSERRA